MGRWILVVVILGSLYVCPVHAARPAGAGVAKLMPPQWEFREDGPLKMWRTKDRAQTVVVAGIKRLKRLPVSVRQMENDKFDIIQKRADMLAHFGFRDIVAEDVSVKSFKSRGTVIDLKFRYREPGGRRMQVREFIYSSPDKIRSVSHRFPLHHAAANQSPRVLKRFEPKWFDRRPASSEGVTPDEMEASACCTDIDPTPALGTGLAALPSSIPEGKKRVSWKDRPECKDVDPSDLKADRDQGLPYWEGIYNDSFLSTPVGCAQGVYDLPAGLVSEAWKLSTDSKHREEIATALGALGTALWNDPIGTMQKAVVAVAEELAENWTALPCLNDRASMRALCKAVVGAFAGGYAWKILKQGFSATSATMPGFQEMLARSLKPTEAGTSTSGQVAAELSVSSAAKSAAGSVKDGGAKGVAASAPQAVSRAVQSVQAIDVKSLPFKTSLTTNLQKASDLGSMNDDLVISRVKMLTESPTRNKGYDELRRLDFILSSVLKENGKDLASKVDNFLNKTVKDADERSLMRSCLLK